MTIYSLYIFDRHCNCIYYQDWHRTKRPRPAGKDALLPAVSRAISYQPPTADGVPQSTFTTPRNTLISSSGIVVAINIDEEALKQQATSTTPSISEAQKTALPFDEEAKLVYGVVSSLRNMIKKLSKRDEQFTAFRTSTYKLHLYETPSLYKFVLLTDPRADTSVSSPSSVRFALRQIYAGPFLDFVVRNPLIPMDSRTQGIDNEYFRASVDRHMRAYAFFQ